MLLYNFQRLFRMRGITRPFTFLKSHGFSASFATKVNRDRVLRLNLAELERLCEAFCCTPNDLLEWVPSAQVLSPGKHPLFPLHRKDDPGRIFSMVASLPVEKIREMEELVRAKLSEEDQL